MLSRMNSYGVQRTWFVVLAYRESRRVRVVAGRCGVLA